MSDADMHRYGLLALQVLGVTTAIAWSLRAAVIPLLKRWAASTASKRDDDIVTGLEVTLDVVIAVCDVLRRMPHLTVGPLPRTQPIARTLPPPPPPDDGVTVAIPRRPTRFEVPSIPTQPLVTPPPDDGREPR